MEKIKNLFKNKKFIIVFCSIVLLIVGALVIFFIMNGNKKDEKVLKKEMHTMYVKINPLVKLTFELSYYECLDENGEKTICGESSQLVTDYQLINDDAKEFYKEMDFKGKDVMNVVIALCDTARDNNIGFNSLEITSDYNFDQKKIADAIKDGSKYNTTYNVFVDFLEHIDEDKIIESEKEGPIVTYTVKFDANGGTSVDDVVIRENDLLLAPVAPTKKGYVFVSWQLDGKDFDFKTPITKDIKLKAKWKKEESKEVIKEEETKQIEWSFNCKDIKFANVGEGLLVKCPDAYKNYTINLTVTKSLANKHKNRNELLKYLTITADLNGKKVGNHDVFVKVTSSNNGISASVKDKVNLEVHKKPVSNLNKINLNENIMINKGDAFSSCGDSTIIFASNLEELYPDMVKKDEKGNKIIYLIRDSFKEEIIKNGYWSESEFGRYNLESKFNEKYDQINWNTQKEEEVNKILKEMEKEVVPGIKNFQGGLQDHVGFHYYYDYLNIYDDAMFNTLDKELKDAHNKFWNKLDKALVGYTTLAYYDACGTGPDETMLTEEICKEFHLNCGRW